MAGDTTRVVIVTMDSHLSSAVTRAETVLRREMPGLSLTIHAADEWASDADALAECHADIAQGDIVIATMLFLEDHIRAVQPALAARREACDAMVCCMSAGEVTRLTKLGRFDMSKEASGALAMLKRLRGKPDAKGGSSGQGQMKMLKRLPKLMKFIPGTAQDVRTYFLALQYWLGGSDENLANMVRMLVGKYAGGRLAPAAAPIEYPETGVYHPRMPGRIGTDARALPKGGLSGTVGLILLRSYSDRRQRRALRRGDRRHRGARPARGAGLRQRARCPAGDRAVFHDRRRALGGCGGQPHRVLAGGWPRIQ